MGNPSNGPVFRAQPDESRIRAYQAEAQVQLKTSTQQENPEWPTHEPPNGQKCETHGSEFYTKIFWELKRRDDDGGENVC